MRWFIPVLMVLGLSGLSLTASAQVPDRPNLIFILADDLGYGELGCYGQQVIQTPRLDRMAAEGLRWTQFYAGSTVCAPSRAVLMTGQHLGHTHVRGNAGGADRGPQSLRAEDFTVAELLRDAGYRTALCGKWGLGDDAPGCREGLPRNQGFDFFYGYLNQRHAHNYYPEFLWRNETREPLRNVVQAAPARGGFVGGWATDRVDYSHDLVMNEALDFIRRQADRQEEPQPFFLYLALTIPHANNEGTRGTGNGQEVPDFGIYHDRPWSDPDKGQAAMITRMDRDVGRLLDLLKDLEIDQQTVVMFSSDNGPHNEGGHHPALFRPAGPLRGQKRDLLEGGIRVPLIVRWPGTISPGEVTSHIGYFGDLMATAAELAGVETPPHLDSISFLPTLKGQAEQQRQHDYLYWEFYEQGGKQALRQGRWKILRSPWMDGASRLYDLERDPGETRDLAAEQPELVKQLESRLVEAHRPHPHWQPRGGRK